MNNLTSKKDWDELYNQNYYFKRKEKGFAGRINNLLRLIFGKKILAYTYSYSDYYLFNVILNKFINNHKGLRVLEIGSAPGHFLIELNKIYGYEPYGVEFSEFGVKLNRTIFKQFNINPNNVIHADFTSSEFQNQYREKFDVVISRGFVEHFRNVKSIFNQHINVLKKEGLLIISIPNFRGFNYGLVKLFDKDLLLKHNTNIMEIRFFSKVIEALNIQKLYLDYYGTFNFNIFTPKKEKIKGKIYIVCKYFQLLLNLVFHICLNEKNVNSRLFSPYIIFIGVKKNYH